MSWSTSAPRYSYTVGQPPAYRASTSSTEILHLAVAYVVLTFDLLLILGWPYFYTHDVLLYTAIAASAALTGFIAHEMAHKIVAQSSGYWAEFRLSPLGLVTSVIIAAATGFLFAAPGATMIGGMGNLRDWGRTSLAGPAVNFVFSLGFLAASLVLGSYASLSYAASVLLFLAFINAWFAAFNMIPFGPLDGAKVWRWSHQIWVVAFVAFAVLAGALYYLIASSGGLPF